MAVIKCSLKRDGRLKVVEVLEFQKGDTIEIERSKADIKRPLSADLVGIIPCPGTGKGRQGRADCWTCLRPFHLTEIVEKR